MEVFTLDNGMMMMVRGSRSDAVKVDPLMHPETISRICETVGFSVQHEPGAAAYVRDALYKSLPARWKCYWTAELSSGGVPYFYNSETKLSQWQHPYMDLREIAARLSYSPRPSSDLHKIWIVTNRKRTLMESSPSSSRRPFVLDDSLIENNHSCSGSEVRVKMVDGCPMFSELITKAFSEYFNVPHNARHLRLVTFLAAVCPLPEGWSFELLNGVGIFTDDYLQKPQLAHPCDSFFSCFLDCLSCNPSMTTRPLVSVNDKILSALRAIRQESVDVDDCGIVSRIADAASGIATGDLLTHEKQLRVICGNAAKLIRFPCLKKQLLELLVVDEQSSSPAQFIVAMLETIDRTLESAASQLLALLHQQIEHGGNSSNKQISADIIHALLDIRYASGRACNDTEKACILHALLVICSNNVNDRDFVFGAGLLTEDWVHRADDILGAFESGAGRPFRTDEIAFEIRVRRILHSLKKINSIDPSDTTPEDGVHGPSTPPPSPAIPEECESSSTSRVCDFSEAQLAQLSRQYLPGSSVVFAGALRQLSVDDLVYLYSVFRGITDAMNRQLLIGLSERDSIYGEVRIKRASLESILLKAQM